MVALKERLGRTLEGLGKGLQKKESERFEDTPYGNAQRLWRSLAPDRKIDPLKSAFLKFTSAYDGEGVKPQNEEQTIFCNLLNPYRSLFPEWDSFLVSLSLSHPSDDVSFKLTVFAPPPSPEFNFDKPYSVLTILELPEQKRYYGNHVPYNVVILRESKLYTGKLDQEFVGLGPQKEGIFKELKQWHDEPQGDPGWRRNFASETLKFLTSIVGTNGECSIISNQDAQLAFKQREKEVPWWKKSWSDKRQLGAVYPDNTNLSVMRLSRFKYGGSEYPINS